MAKKKESKPKKTSKKWENYDGGKPKNQYCPKCGVGVFLAEHKDRRTCGKCGYTEFK